MCIPTPNATYYVLTHLPTTYSLRAARCHLHALRAGGAQRPLRLRPLHLLRAAVRGRVAARCGPRCLAATATPCNALQRLATPRNASQRLATPRNAPYSAPCSALTAPLPASYSIVPPLRRLAARWRLPPLRRRGVRGALGRRPRRRLLAGLALLGAGVPVLLPPQGTRRVTACVKC